MTGWKIPTMNESMYVLLKMVDFPASHVKFSGGVKSLGWVCAGPGLIRKWLHQDIGHLHYSTKPSNCVETCHAQVLHECKRPKTYTTNEEILHHLGCLKLYQYWDIYVLHQLVQDVFHQQYTVYFGSLWWLQSNGGKKSSLAAWEVFPKRNHINPQDCYIFSRGSQ